MASGVELSVESVEVKIEKDAWMKVFKSESMRQELLKRANAIADAANSASSADTMESKPFGADATIGKKTALGTVFTHTPHGYNAKERILDSIGAGGD